MNVSVFPLLMAYRYWILFPLAFIEGPIVALIAGLFVSKGTLSIVPTYIILCFGDFIPDVLYFGLARLSHHSGFFVRYLHRFGFSKERISAIEHLWQHHTFKSALIAKWAYGMSTPLLMTAGLSRLPARKFLRTIIPIIMTQYAILLVIGYYFGSSYQMISTYIQNAEWLIAIGVIVFLVAYFFVARSAKKALLRDTK